MGLCLSLYVNVTPTKYGTIYFNYIKDNPGRPFDETIDAIRNSAKIFGLDFNIDYETHSEHIAGLKAKYNKSTKE